MTTLDERAERDLARMNQAREAKGRKPKDGKAAADKRSSGKANPFTAMRPRFVLREGKSVERPGVHCIEVARSAEGDPVELEPVWICAPLKVAAMTRDAHGGEWGRLLVFRDRDGLEHRWAMPMTMLARKGEDLREALLRQGLDITQHEVHRKRLNDYIAGEEPEAKARCVPRTGWHGDAFVLPAETFGERDDEPLIFQGSSEGVELGTAGTLDGWRDDVSAPCAGHSRLVLALSCAFAGPCLGLVDAEGGGLHFRGASSTGKTTALAVAASVFGPAAFMRTWRATGNALESIAVLHSDLLLPLDEIAQLDPKDAGATAYLLANGQGKARAQRDGTARAASRFRVLFVSAGEVGLGDLVTEAGGTSRAGHDVRVIDVPADVDGGSGIFDRLPDGGSAGAFADSLRRAAATHHGHALRAWLEVLTMDRERMRDALRDCRDALADDLAGRDAVGQVRRVAQRFALIAAAGELATAKGITGWPQGEAERAARACYAAWLQARGTSGAAEPAAMLARVRLFLMANGDSRFQAWNTSDADTAHRPRTVNRAGYRKAVGAEGPEQTGPIYYIEREVFRGEVCRGFDHRQVARVLAQVGALRLGSGGDHTRNERPQDGHRARFYVILFAALSSDGATGDAVAGASGDRAIA